MVASRLADLGKDHESYRRRFCVSLSVPSGWIVQAYLDVQTNHTIARTPCRSAHRQILAPRRPFPWPRGRWQSTGRCVALTVEPNRSAAQCHATAFPSMERATAVQVDMLDTGVQRRQFRANLVAGGLCDREGEFADRKKQIVQLQR